MTTNGQVTPETDAEARSLAATTFDRPVTVEAGAGTGKTTLLIHRLLVWVLDRGWEQTASTLAGSSSADGADAAQNERIACRLLDRVVAITFTEAAAAELAERFVDAIAAASHGEHPTGFEPGWLQVDESTLKDRARWLLPQVDRAHIATIHAWCYELLRRHPYDSGVHPELEIIADPQEIEATAREVVETHYRVAYRSGYDSDLVVLGEEKLGPRDWVELVRRWVVAGWDIDSHLPEDDSVEGAMQVVAESCGVLMTAIGDRLAAFPATSRTARTVAAVARTRDLTSAADYDGEATLEKILSLWRDHGKDTADMKRVSEWAGGSKIGKAETEAFGSRLKEVVEAASNLRTVLRVLQQIDPERWRRRQRVLKAAVQDTETALHDASAVTFGGLLRQTFDLLTGNAAVAASERARIDLLLVDEFQDTDGLQAGLIEAVALEGGARPSLIVVGDPKQSIYGWRNADLETYERVRNRILERDGLELILSRNFRSTTTVLAVTDGIVGSQMKRDPGFQPQYHRLLAGAEHAGNDPAPVQIHRFDTNSAAEQARHEAEWAATDLAERQQRGDLQWHQAAILIRSKTHVRTILRALRAAGIPYEMSADVGFHERSEVIDGAAWVRVIADPKDQVALLKVLRSPTVGMPDAALARAWEPLRILLEDFDRPDADREASIRRILDDSLTGVSDVPGLDRIEGWVDHAAASLGHIGRLRRDLRRRPFAEFVDELRLVTAIEAIEARRPEGAARVANLVKLFDQLVQQVEETGGDTHAVLRVLRRGIYFELPAEEAVPLKPIDGAVQVATVHAVKGLEFDHLYLLHFGMGGGRDDTDLQVETAVDGATLIKGVAHPQWVAGKLRRDRVSDAETLRLLYVALTRARHRLVICLPGKSRAGTLGHLIENGLIEGNSADLEAALDQVPVADNLSDAMDRETIPHATPLPNPPWMDPQEPGPLIDTPSRRKHETPTSPYPVAGEPGGAERGSRIHQLLAAIDLSSPAEDLPARFQGDEAVRDFWPAFSATASGQRLLALGGRLRGREVDVLTRSDLLESDSSAGCASGTIDLLYQESDGSWVVADYKTGHPDDLQEAVSHYAPQLRFYGRALAEALALDQPPRLELWFVDLDRIEVVSSK